MGERAARPDPPGLRPGPRAVRGHLERAGASPLGADAGERAGRNYFAGPYLRDELLGLGVFVETLETSHTWSRYHELYEADELPVPPDDGDPRSDRAQRPGPGPVGLAQGGEHRE